MLNYYTHWLDHQQRQHETTRRLQQAQFVQIAKQATPQERGLAKTVWKTIKWIMDWITNPVTKNPIADSCVCCVQASC